MIDIEKLAAAVSLDGWIVNTVDIDSNGISHTCDINLLKRSAQPKVDPEAWREENLAKQAAGVKFEQRRMDNTWHYGVWMFDGHKKDYREVPQEPRAAERALWKAQREAGTNEVWQAFSRLSKTWCDLDNEPKWYSDTEYRVKPMKLTAKIVRNKPMTFREYVTRVQDWEFTGTREEYRAECEKYGYFVTGKIKEVEQVKPKTVKWYLCLLKSANCDVPCSYASPSKERMIEFAMQQKCAIIGNIETREVEA